MTRYYVYRHGSNAANQPMTFEPVHVATIKSDNVEHAIDLASKRVTVYNNQYLSAKLADEVDKEEKEIDSHFEYLEN